MPNTTDSADSERTAPTTPGRPSDSSRQQKHKGQNLQSGSESLDRKSTHDADAKAPVPPGPK